MTQILGFAGKKQSGKNTACNYIIALKLAELGVSKKTRLSPNGQIEVTDIFGEKKDDKEWFEFSKKSLNVEKLFEDSLGQYVRIYGLADTLKDLCIDVLGLSHAQAYGTDENKNSSTPLLWEDVPTWENSSLNENRGHMTAREVLQYIGTDIFRKIDPDVWIKSLLRKIRKDSPEVALICDVRFKNEIVKLQEAGGFVVGLTRDPYNNSDSHSSEKEIEEGLSLCDCIVDNHDKTIQQQLELIHSCIEHLPSVLPVMET